MSSIGTGVSKPIMIIIYNPNIFRFVKYYIHLDSFYYNL